MMGSASGFRPGDIVIHRWDKNKQKMQIVDSVRPDGLIAYVFVDRGLEHKLIHPSYLELEE